MPLEDFRSIHLPYCIKRQKDGRFLVLNREYKPLGFASQASVEYDDYPIAVSIKGLTASVAAKVAFNGSSDLNAIYLYDDGCIPTDSPTHMKNYLARLAVLAKLKANLKPPRASKR